MYVPCIISCSAEGDVCIKGTGGAPIGGDAVPGGGGDKSVMLKLDVLGRGGPPILVLETGGGGPGCIMGGGGPGCMNDVGGPDAPPIGGGGCIGPPNEVGGGIPGPAPSA